MQWIRQLLLTLTAMVALGGAVFAAPFDPAKIDVLKLSEWSVTAADYGGSLLLSDSPEIVLGDGIMYQDTVSGDSRLFFHHVNGTNQPKKITVLLQNPGNEPVDVTVYRWGVGGPGMDYLAVGKAAQNLYLASTDIYLVEVPAHGSAVLADPLENAVVQPLMLVNGIFDFRSEKPVTVKTMMMPVNADTKKFNVQAQVLPTDQYKLRGTFPARDRMIIPNQVYNPHEDGPAVITLADNRLDPYVWGVDATDGSKVQNYGNYGIVYYVWLPSDQASKVGYYLNPRGGEYAGAIGIKYQHQGKRPVLTPPDRISFGGDKLNDFAPLGNYESGQSLWLTFSPPGASNLPVKLLILPEAR